MRENHQPGSSRRPGMTQARTGLTTVRDVGAASQVFILDRLLVTMRPRAAPASTQPIVNPPVRVGGSLWQIRFDRTRRLTTLSLIA